jgi:membrane protein DedA with SNARE-associated domain
LTIDHLISQYGYIALIIGTFFEGETILIAGGFAAHLGHLRLPWVMLAAFAGSLAGDQFYFYLGRLKGRAFLERRPRWKAKADRVTELVDRYRTPLMLGFRFMPGFRTVTPFTIGLTGVGKGRFLILNAIGGLFWAVTVSLIGYFFSFTAEAALAGTRKYHRWIMLGIIFTGALIWTCYFLRRSRHKRIGQDSAG